LREDDELKWKKRERSSSSSLLFSETGISRDVDH